MSDEEYEDNIATLRYFWEDKGDVTCWVGWKAFQPVLAQRDALLHKAICDYYAAKHLLSRLLQS